MEANDNFELKIDDYLLNRLTIDEMNYFEKQMKKDNNLRAKVEAQRDIVEGLESYGRIKLKSELKAIHGEYFGNSNFHKWKKWIIGFLISLLILTTYLLVVKNNNLSSSKDLYLAYFEPYDYSTASRSTDNSSLFTLGVLYNQKKYTELINRFENNFENHVEQPSDLLLAIGIAYLESNNAQKAREYFNLITEKGDFNFEEEVKWYTAMSYLKEENKDSVKSLLQYFIENRSSFYHDQAMQLDLDLK